MKEREKKIENGRFEELWFYETWSWLGFQLVEIVVVRNWEGKRLEITSGRSF